MSENVQREERNEGEAEVYVMSALDGSAKKNLTNNVANDVVYPD